MTRHTPWAVAALATVVLTLPVALTAQTPMEVIEAATQASPLRYGGEARHIRWHPDHSYETLKQGDNEIVCYDRSDERDRSPFAAQCTHLANLTRVAQNRRFRAESTDAASERALIDAAEANGTRAEALYGSLWFRMDGPDAESALLHATIAVPGATTASTGLPESRRQGGVWIMDGGTAAAHIMIPGR